MESISGNSQIKYSFLGTDSDHEDIFLLEQIHSNQVLVIDDSYQISDSLKFKGDALITSRKNFRIGVRTADCVPILIFDSQKNKIGAIHAGWKGIISGIIENTILKFQEIDDSKIENIEAIIGPAICESCFEVKEDVLQEFQKKFSKNDLSEIINEDQNKIFINLKKSCEMILKSLDLKKENIKIMTECTLENNQFYSYRGGDINKRNYSSIYVL